MQVLEQRRETGKDILASVAPPSNDGRDFDLYTGTSMSSPHVNR
jgi:hypothetical protein